MSKFPLKILFVIFDNFKTERLGIQILSSIAREEGYQRDLLILNATSPEEALKKVRDFNPRIIAYSGMTFEQFDLQAFNQLLKEAELQFISIFGGHHYTFNPEEIYRDKNIDVICRGEGETAFRSFIRAIRDEKEYRHTEKLWVRFGDEVIENPIGKLITDLDSIPFPDRDLIPIYDEGEQIFGNSVSVMFTRGCPNQCTYCYNSKWNELFRDSRICRHRSLDNVLAEIKQIIKTHDLDFIYFHDDNFTLIPREIITEFCRRYPREIGKPFFAQFRAELIDEALIVKLKEAGMAVSTVGVECGDEKVANNLLKRGKVTNQDIIHAFQIFNKHGIRSFSQNMVAYPIPNPLEIDLKTIQLNIECKPTWASFAILIPIPKTRIWEYAITNDYLEKDAFTKADKLPSVFTRTRLNYHDASMTARVNNLHKFASIAVKFPFLLPVIKILIHLPPNPVFQYIHFGWYGYWNTVGLFKTKFSFALLTQGIKTIRKYLKKH